MKELTVEEALDRIGVGRFHVIFVIVAAVLLATQSIEVYILSILGPLLRCAWQLSSFQVAFLTSFVYVGFLLGALVIGTVADRIGRKGTVIIFGLGTAYFGILSGFAPTYPWLLFMRALLGFSVSGILITILLLMVEFSSSEWRGKLQLIVYGMWPFGGFLLTGIAYLTVPTLGWRGLLIMNSLPVLAPVVALFFMPKSPRYLLAQGWRHEAEEVLNWISKFNKREPFTGTLVLPSRSSEVTFWKSWKSLRPMWFTLTLFFALRFLIDFQVTSHVFIVVLLPQSRHRCLQNFNNFSHPINSGTVSDVSCCSPITTSTYVSILSSCTGELVSMVITVPLIDLLGRRTLLATTVFIYTPTILFLGFCQPVWSTELLIFVSRTLIASSYSVLLIYQNEILPTSIRGSATGILVFAGYLGDIMCPYLVQILIPEGYGTETLIFNAILAILAGALTCLIPIETKNRRLYDTIDESLLFEGFKDDRYDSVKQFFNIDTSNQKTYGT